MHILHVLYLESKGLKNWHKNNEIKMDTIREDGRNLGEGGQYNEGHGKMDMIPLYYMPFENITTKLIIPYKYNIQIKLWHFLQGIRGYFSG